MSPEGGLDLLTAVLQTVGGRHLQQQQLHHSTHFIHTLIGFLHSMGKQVLASASTPGFIKLTGPLVGGLAWFFPSFLILFGKVHLAATGRP